MRLSVDRDVKRLFDNPVVLPLVVFGMVVVGGILRLVVARQDLFGDELATYWVVSTRGLRGVVETVSTTAEITPPFSFVLSWLTTRLGLSPELVRLPALIAGIAAIPLVYAVGTRTVGRSAAVLGAALTTLSPFMIFYSAEARGYGLLMGLLLLSTLALLLAIDTDQAGWWVLYGLCVCLAAYTHYTAVFVLVGQLGWAVWAHPRSRRPCVDRDGGRGAALPPVDAQPQRRRRLTDDGHPECVLPPHPRRRPADPGPLVRWLPVRRPDPLDERPARDARAAAARRQPRSGRLRDLHDALAAQGVVRPERRTHRPHPGARTRYAGRQPPAERRRRQRLQHPQPGRLVAVPGARGGRAHHRRPTRCCG